MEWYLKVLKNYSNFKVRAHRKEYWIFFLFNAIFIFCAAIIDRFNGFTFDNEKYGLITALYSLILFITYLKVGVRRLHDIVKSGYMILVGLIPVVGPIWLLILFVKEGVPSENEYGHNTKE